MSKFIKQKCIHCLNYYEDLTADHILPKSWYPNSTPSGMEKWVAPACLVCNSRLGTLEEEVFDRLSICLDDNDIASWGLNKKKLQEYPKNKNVGRQIKFLMDTVKNFVSYPYKEGNLNILKGGTPKEGVRGKLMIRIPGDRLYPVAEKIIRGLEYKLRNKLILEDQKIELIIPHEHNKKEMDLIDKWDKLIIPTEKNIHRGPGLMIRYATSEADNNWILYHIRIWNHLEFWAMVHPLNIISKKMPETSIDSNKYLNKAIRLLKQDKSKESLRLIDLSINLNPDNFYAYTVKSKVLMNIKKYNEALEAIDNAIRLNPDNFQAAHQKVSLLGILDKYDELIDTADTALQLKYDNHYIWYKKGLALFDLKKYKEAIDAFTEALKICPNFNPSIIKKIQSLLAIGDFKKAVDFFELSNLPKEDCDDLVNNIGYAYLELKMFNKAEQYLNKAEVVDNKNIATCFNFYKLFFHSRKYFKASIYYCKFRYLYAKSRMTSRKSKYEDTT